MKKRGKVTAASADKKVAKAAQAAEGEEAPKPKKRRTKAEIEAAKLEKEM